jgi:hypothetical protein
MAIAVAAVYVNAWNTTTSPKTASVTVAVGDFLVVMCASGATNDTYSTTGGSPALTFTSRTQANTPYASTAILTAPCAAAQTFTISVARAVGTFVWGAVVLRLTGVTATGAVKSASDNTIGSEQTTITTTAAGSAIAVILKDADSGNPVTWSTATAGTFTAEGTTNTTASNYPGIYLDAGAAGVKTIGLAAAGGLSSNISAVELTTPAATVYPRKPLIVRQAMKRASFY